MNELKCEHVSKSFRTKKVLEDINVTFHAGMVYGLVGENGCGKSVFLKCLCGLLTPDEGRILWNGKELKRDTFYDVNFGASIEKPEFINDLTGYENLKYLASFRKATDRKEILKWMKWFDLYSSRDEKAGTYSLGMKQKLAIIQAVMEHQNVVLLDEVSNSLDEESRAKLLKLVHQLKESGRIVIYVNHNRQEVENIADVIYRIRNRRLVKCG